MDVIQAAAIRRSARPWVQAIAGNAGVRFFTFATGIVLARALGPSGRGLITVAMLWPGVMISFASIMNTQTATYFAARFGRRGLATCVRLAAINSALLLIIALAANWALLRSRYPSLYYPANVFALSIPLSMLGGVYSGALLAQARIGWYWTARIATGVGPFFIVAALAVAHSLTVGRYVFAVDGGLLSALLFAWYAERSTENQAAGARPTARAVLSYGAKIVITSLPSQLNFRFDQLVLTLLAAPVVIGQYAVATTWSSVVSIFGTALGTVVQSAAVRLDATDAAAVARAVRDIRRAFVALAVVAVVASPIALWGLPLVFGERFAPAITAAMILCGAALLTNAKLLIRDFGRGLGRPTLPLGPEVIGAVVRLAALLALLPQMGAMGAALAATLSAMATLLGLAVETGRRIPHVGPWDLLPRTSDFDAVISQLGARRSRTRGIHAD